MLPIITTTYFRYEKYCDLLVGSIDKTWPGHPPIWIITDRGHIKYKNKICVDSSNWVMRLHHGLKYLKNLYPDIEYVYLIIEDLYPLQPCAVDRLSEIQGIVLAHKLNYVSFVTYNWGGRDQVQIDGVIFYRMPRSFSFYSQIQPAIWRLSHLMETCEYALKNGINDCWGFEYIAISDDHFVADYRWPSIFNGLLVNGKVNPSVLFKKIKIPEGKKLKQLLIRDYIFQHLYIIRKIFKRIYSKIKGHGSFA